MEQAIVIFLSINSTFFLINLSLTFLKQKQDLLNKDFIKQIKK